VYTNAFNAMAEDSKEDNLVTASRRGPGTLIRRQTTMFQYSRSTSEHDTLIFYTRLIRLLAYCSSELKQSTNGSLDEETSENTGFQQNKKSSIPSSISLTLDNRATNRHKQSIIARTRNILQNLIRVEDLVGILSTNFEPDLDASIHPSHKEAVLLFLNRVYGIPDSELLVKLISKAFLPDIKYALQLTKVSVFTFSQAESELI